MVSPVPEGTPVSFAYRQFYKTGKRHKGVDFGCVKGTPVFAAVGGRVWYAGVGGGWGPAYGAHIIIKGSVDGEVRYVQVAHLSKIGVRTGDVVTAGQQIGNSGGVPGQWGAGNSTGAHVHFQVNKSSFWSDHVDPWPAINQGALIDARLGKWEFVNHGMATIALRKVGAWAKYLYRRTNVVNITKTIHPDVLGGLECGSRSVFEYLWKKYLSFGLERVVGAGGRWIWRRTATTTLIEKGIFKPIPYDGDVKEAPWFVGEVEGAKMLTVLAHLDPTAPASFNVRRAQEILDFAEVTAVRHNMGKSQIVVMIDTADKTGAVRKYIKGRGYESVFIAADRTVNGSLACMTYYKQPVEGPSVCMVAVWKGDQPPGSKGPNAPRPVEVASKTIPPRTGDLDHLPLAAVLNRQ